MAEKSLNDQFVAEEHRNGCVLPADLVRKDPPWFGCISNSEGGPWIGEAEWGPLAQPACRHVVETTAKVCNN